MLARKHWFTIASAAISVITIYALYRWLKGQGGEIDLPSGREAVAYIVLGVAVYLLSFLMRGLRWRMLLSEVGVKAPLHETTGLLTVGYAANTLLPARAGDVVRVFLMAQRTQAKPSLMVSTLIAERLLDVMVLATTFVITSLIFAGGLPTGGKAVAAVALCVVAVIGLLVVRWAIRSDHIPPGVRGILRDASLAVRQLRGSKHLAQAAGLTTAAWTLEACVYLISAHAVGIHLNLGSAAYVLSTAAMFTLIPSGPGFVGTMDSALAFTLHVLEEPKNLVGSYILTVRFIVFIPITVIGGILLVVRYGGFAAIKAARESQSQENDEAEAAARAKEPLPDLPTGEMAALQADQVRD
ncbi:MAG: lysylphosphatidylglycerol synthase transmembrane domain-containing protein [Solirubrobacteraceae bacterium]|nr:lysylphosphatidylglycerol synthase transmembrane domain-containing protein [Solirubrobacteraceae bacterium]